MRQVVICVPVSNCGYTVWLALCHFTAHHSAVQSSGQVTDLLEY